MRGRLSPEVRSAILTGVDEAVCRSETLRAEHLLLGVLHHASVALTVMTRNHGLTPETVQDALQRLDVDALASVGVRAASAPPRRPAPGPRWRRFQRAMPFSRATVERLRASSRSARMHGREAELPDVAVALVVHGGDSVGSVLDTCDVDRFALAADLRSLVGGDGRAA